MRSTFLADSINKVILSTGHKLQRIKDEYHRDHCKMSGSQYPSPGPVIRSKLKGTPETLLGHTIGAVKAMTVDTADMKGCSSWQL